MAGSTEEQIGYLTARVEGLDQRLDEMDAKDRDHHEEEELRWRKIEEHMQAMKVKVGIADAMWSLAKVMGTISVLIATLKFGDIPEAIYKHFGH